MAPPLPRHDPAVKLFGSWANAARGWNLVILGEGYNKDQLTDFHVIADTIAQRFHEKEPPFERLRAALNIFRIDVISNQSWNSTPINTWWKHHDDVVKLPTTTPQQAEQIWRQATCAMPFIDTAFKARFCLGGIPRLLGGDAELALAVARSDPRLPRVDGVLVLVNTEKFSGGGGGDVAWTSVEAGSDLVAVHEVGHSAFGLEDEYYWEFKNDENKPYRGAEPHAPNVCTQSAAPFPKWRELLTPDTPLPTSAAHAGCPQLQGAQQLADGTYNVDPAHRDRIGAFEGGARSLCGIFRPAVNCCMRDHEQRFCAVCDQVIVQRLGGHLFGNGATFAEQPFDGGTQLLTIEAPRRDAEARLLTYDIMAGEYALHPCLPFADIPGTPTPSKGSIAPFWTSLTSVVHDGKPHILAIQRGSGLAALYRCELDRVNPVLEHVWGADAPGFGVALPRVLSAVPFTHDGKLHWIEYDIISGDGIIKRIDPGTNAPTVVRTVHFGKGKTGFIPMQVPVLSKTHFMSCEIMTGKLELHQIDGSGVSTEWSQDGFLGAGVTDLMPLRAWNGNPFVLVYSRFTGWVRFFRVRNLAYGLEFVYREFIGPAPFEFMPFGSVTDERRFYMRYRWPMIPGQKGAIAAFNHG